ncbi:MAG: hypothetical protein ACK559_38735, partial [bacterium]
STTPFSFNGTSLRLEVQPAGLQFPPEAEALDSKIQLTWEREPEEFFLGMLIRSSSVAAIFSHSPVVGSAGPTFGNLGTQLIHYSPLGRPAEAIQSADVYLELLNNTTELMTNFNCGIFTRFGHGDNYQWAEDVCQQLG